MPRTVYGLVLLAALMLAGCEPAHINPLDPDSEHYLPPPPVDAPEAFIARVRSVHIVHSPESQAYTLTAETWSLGEQVIHAASLQYPGRSSAWALRAIGNGVWSARIASSVFNDPYLGSVIGQPFRMTIYTADDSAWVRTPLYLFRVIDAAPELLEPDSHDVTDGMPELRWGAYAADFPFHFLVSVVRPVDPPMYEVEVWNSGPLADTARAVTVETGLSGGSYYWTVSVVDTFDNTARSMAGNFLVPAGASAGSTP